jgi:hypothetical protein
MSKFIDGLSYGWLKKTKKNNLNRFFVASCAESWLPQGNLNQPDMAFCFMWKAIS